MAAFIAPLPSLNRGTHRDWILEEPLWYRSSILEDTITVPAGFSTDLASVPKWVPRWLIDVNEEHEFAAIVHDYLCRTWPLDRRHVADAVFREAMEVRGVVAWKRWTMWAAVRGLTVWLRVTRRGNK